MNQTDIGALVAKIKSRSPAHAAAVERVFARASDGVMFAEDNIEHEVLSELRDHGLMFSGHVN